MKTILLYDEVFGVDPAVFQFPGDNYLTNFNICAINSAAFCQGFTWNDATNSFSNLVKGNTLFWMARMVLWISNM